MKQLVNGLAWGSIYALIALGYTMVYGVLALCPVILPRQSAADDRIYIGPASMHV